jgi:hypothetical protein
MPVTRRLDNERGQLIAMFALMLPVFLAIGGIVVGIGNWYVHAKNLQTKADAGALAGGQSWEFPCGSTTDDRIDGQARVYAGSYNPQVGGVPNTNVHSVLNGPDWYDDDTNPAPTENRPICPGMVLDVKVTESNSFPLASLIPLFPDIKRKAVVQIQEAEGVTGLLPIAIRAPEPTSAAAVFYDEQPGSPTQGQIKAVRYLVKKTNPLGWGMPGSLQGWTTENPDDPNYWAQFSPTQQTGVVIAISFRGACNTSLPPNPNDRITVGTQPNCFEDAYLNQPVNNLCNQVGRPVSTEVVNCYYATGNWPSQSTGAGLHFIQGFSSGGASDGPPLLKSAYLQNATCLVTGTLGTGYFNAHPLNSCTALLRATIDLGSADPDGVGPLPVTDRSATNAEVRYRIVNDTGNYSGGVCTTYSATCDLNGSGSGANSSWETQQVIPRLNANTRRNSIVMRVRLNNTRVGATQCPNAPAFNATCEWFFTSDGTVGNAPNDATALAKPIQRAFRGNSIISTNIQWLRLTTDRDCDGFSNEVDGAAASVQTGTCAGFVVDMGLKGGIAQSANEPAVLFDDGTASNQNGFVDCDPNVPQGQELEDSVLDGCKWWYARHPFDYPSPYVCPDANDLFDNGNPKDPNYNPGYPWDDGRWPPTRCIDTRQTGTGNQLEKGLKLRFFGDKNANSTTGCPPVASTYVRGRNYWDKDTPNGYVVPAPTPEDPNPTTLGYAEGTHVTHFADGDPRIVTIFVTTAEAFTRPPNKTHPITGFMTVYITGFGRAGDAINGTDDDPCPGSTPPPDMDACSGQSCNNYLVWGHILDRMILTPNATPSGRVCRPGTTGQPCVATLVE